MTAPNWPDGKMWPGLISQTEVIIHQGSVYAPLLFDPEIEAELTALAGKESPPPGEVQDLAESVLRTERGYFIKSLSLASLVEHYPVVFPEIYEQQRAALCREIMPPGTALPAWLGAKFRTILFEVLPHFVRLPQGRRQPRDKGTILAFLAAKLPGNPGDTTLLEGLQAQRRALLQVLERLDNQQTLPGSPPQGWQSGRALAQWLSKACKARLAAREQEVWRQKLAEVEEWLNLPEPQLAVLVTLAAQAEWEVDGFGCQRDPKYPGDYVVYRRTGDYLLKDYFDRLYLFPDCRVGVATVGPYYPMVLDTYKHPLLRRHASWQRICLQDYEPTTEFSGAGIIRALEEGLKALFYGYNSRKRNGYNSLDEFSRPRSLVAFDDWRLGREDPRLMNGDLEVKNNFV